jgi:ribosomal-protein-alanine N-acetyltransferase
VTPHEADPLFLTGPTLTLRYPTAEDAPRLFELAADPAVTRFFSWGPYERLEEPEAYIAALRVKRERGEVLDFGIVHGEDGLIGITGLSEVVRRDRRAVIGTWLGRAHWGGGANRQSKALLLALAFRSLGLLRVSALVSPQNVRSAAALERLGFVPEGVLRGWHVHDGVPRDVAVLRMLREEWERTPLAEVAVEIEGELPAPFVVG